jgi:CSLREA domain-containing protein
MRREILALAAAVAMLGVGAGPASAAVITVDSTADTPDALLDGNCDDGSGNCTLRAAITESNNSTAVDDQIAFDAGFTGALPASRIVLGSALPAVTDTTEIAGADCTGTGPPRPCAEIRGNGLFDGLTFSPGSGGSSVRGIGISTVRNGVVVSGPADTALPVTIGGAAPSAWNAISDSDQDAIRVMRVDGVEVSGNRGTGNDDEFIDLQLPDGPGNFTTQGAAEGLQAPVPQATSPNNSLSGTAEPNAQILVFTKTSSSSGEIEALLATAVADGDGDWTATFPAQDDGQRVAVTQTVPGPGGSEQSSELSVTAQVGSGPHATITKGPPAKLRAKKRLVRVNFEFTITSNAFDLSEIRFECSLDGGPFLPCISPESTKVRKGLHSFQVRARDPLGNAGPAVERAFKVMKKKKKKNR